MSKFSVKINGCFGDVLYSTPVIKYISKSHSEKIDVETNFPELFKNNPYVKKIYDTNKDEFLLDNQFVYNLNNHYFGDIQKQIRKIHLTDYWSTNLGFTLLPEEKTLEFYPDKVEIEIPKQKYVVINPSVTWACRTWDKEKWELLIEKIIKFGYQVVVVGKEINYDGDIKSFINLDNKNIINLVNKLNLSELWYVISNCEVVITTNSGLLPFVGTTDSNLIQIGGAIDPYYRTPYRNGSQNYKHKFVGGSCKIFCQSDLKYNYDGKNKITDGFPEHNCFENKPTYECHPSVNSVFNSFLEFIKKHN